MQRTIDLLQRKDDKAVFFAYGPCHQERGPPSHDLERRSAWVSGGISQQQSPRQIAKGSRTGLVARNKEKARPEVSPLFLDLTLVLQIHKAKEPRFNRFLASPPHKPG
ncbi:hypothetical protein MWN34_01805 [Ancylobacter sp. 6x-1]|uniref:Uncharacterized protein n=1 Tax=Ancylobacter crimeensis TaxID=2579147 RepID=A0ABT0D6R0_9HYPH|nr:hypothetical protein [Ancylobacter crimeensis]MCK0195639.1 hypothetical protein [Ancylobacter crimeensis]